MQGKQPRLTRRLLMMMMDAQGLPFVGRAASFLLTHAPVVSVAYANLRAEEKMREVLDRVQAQMDADLERERQEQAASPDYAALLADVADAATRFLELAGPHLAKIEGEGNWQQVLDANLAVAFALERAVVALVRSTQGNLASKPPGPCAKQPFNSVSLRGTALIHACWRVDHLWLGFCSTKNENTRKSMEEAIANCDYDTSYFAKCYGLTDEQRLAQHQAGLIGERDCALQGRWNFCDIPSEDRNWTEEPGMFMDGGLKGEERRYSADEDELIFDAADWLGEDK